MSSSHPLAGKRIMVVDDDAMMRAVLQRMLTRMNVATLLEAEGAKEAIDRLAETRVDLVISDWNMPGMSGMELFDHVHVRQPKLPFLMLTGRADLESVVAAKRAGVPAYIAKPVSLHELQEKVLALLARDAQGGGAV